MLGAIAGAIGGIALGLTTQLDASGNTTHPYVGLGIGLAGAAIFWGVFEWCIARALLLFAESTALSHGVPLASPSPPTDPRRSAETFLGEVKRITLGERESDQSADLIAEDEIVEMLVATGLDRKTAKRGLRMDGAPRQVNHTFLERPLWSRSQIEAWVTSLTKE